MPLLTRYDVLMGLGDNFALIYSPVCLGSDYPGNSLPSHSPVIKISQKAPVKPSPYWKLRESEMGGFVFWVFFPLSGFVSHFPFLLKALWALSKALVFRSRQGCLFHSSVLPRETIFRMLSWSHYIEEDLLLSRMSFARVLYHPSSNTWIFKSIQEMIELRLIKTPMKLLLLSKFVWFRMEILYTGDERNMTGNCIC